MGGVAYGVVAVHCLALVGRQSANHKSFFKQGICSSDVFASSHLFTFLLLYPLLCGCLVVFPPSSGHVSHHQVETLVFFFILNAPGSRLSFQEVNRQPYYSDLKTVLYLSSGRIFTRQIDFQNPT